MLYLGVFLLITVLLIGLYSVVFILLGDKLFGFIDEEKDEEE